MRALRAGDNTALPSSLLSTTDLICPDLLKAL